MQHCPNLIHALDTGQHIWEVSKSSFLTAPANDAVRHYDVCQYSSLTWSVLWMIHFPYYRPETLDCTLSQTNFLTLPPTRYLKTLYTDNLYIWSRWSTGNRGRATSASEVIEVAGSNHAIGVILNLAWGPNNFSPSMIWSWRTRSNSQTGLGAE